MPEQITYYHDILKISPFCHRVEIALLETGAPFKSHSVDIYDKPAWFAAVNPLTGKVPAITYGGPADAPPEDPSPASSKITESFVLLEFLADLFSDSNLLPSVSDPVARARVRFFIDVLRRDVELPLLDYGKEVPGSGERLLDGLEKLQKLLPDPDASGGGEYAIGKNFTNADCAIVPVLAILEVGPRTYFKGRGKEIGEALGGVRFDRLRRYRKAVWERESVKKVIDFDRMEAAWKAKFNE